jgi:hypothetical protein
LPPQPLYVNWSSKTIGAQRSMSLAVAISSSADTAKRNGGGGGRTRGTVRRAMPRRAAGGRRRVLRSVLPRAPTNQQSYVWVPAALGGCFADSEKVKKWPQRAKIQANPGQQPASSQISTFACFEQPTSAHTVANQPNGRPSKTDTGAHDPFAPSTSPRPRRAPGVRPHPHGLLQEQPVHTWMFDERAGDNATPKLSGGLSLGPFPAGGSRYPFVVLLPCQKETSS